jgi:hypothetical protein
MLTQGAREKEEISSILRKEKLKHLPGKESRSVKTWR